MSNVNHRQFTEVLLPSNPDEICLAEKVEENYLELSAAYQRIRGEILVFPRYIDRDVMRWRQMRVRHKSGDYRHTESELKAVKAVAQWTVDVNMVIRNQKQVVVTWKD
jgi:hypothetical protein